MRPTASLERCPACNAPALPECQSCLSRAIVREEDATVCAEPGCGFVSFCPCGLGLDASDPDEGETPCA